MNLVFVSNILNHHQIALCQAFKKQVDYFYFIATRETEKIGYQTASFADFVLHYNGKDKEFSEEIIKCADVVIFGDCPISLIDMRMSLDKLSFIYSERLFKKNTIRRFIPSTRKKINDRYLRYSNKQLYVLCASAYLINDLSLVDFPLTKCFKWGYFPNVDGGNRRAINENKHKLSILWAGRLIDWKHPEMAIYVASFLNEKNLNFSLTIIGDGPERKKIESLIEKNKLCNKVRCIGSLPYQEVYHMMSEADIFLGTSDKSEGWGAVINEAMSCGSVVVASKVMGAVPYLINDTVNGFVFDEKNQNELNQIVLNIIKGKYRLDEIRKNAYYTIGEEWNAEKAAECFIKLINGYNDGVFIDIPKRGPCSLAINGEYSNGE